MLATLIDAICNAYIMIHLLRVLFLYTKMDMFHPLAQWLNRMVLPVLEKSSAYLPPLKTMAHLDIIILCVLMMLKVILVSVLSMHGLPSLLGLIVWTMGELMMQICNLYFYALVFLVAMRFIPTLASSPIASLIEPFLRPLLDPCQKYIPRLSGVDISAWAAMIGLQILSFVIASPFIHYGQHSLLS